MQFSFVESLLCTSLSAPRILGAIPGPGLAFALGGRTNQLLGNSENLS